MNARNKLIIFSKNPELGHVKTRLAKHIGNDHALDVYLFLLNHTAEFTKEVCSDKTVYYSKYLGKEDMWDSKIYTKKIQQGADLGERMLQAFADGFNEGYERIIIIGSDLHDLTTEEIDYAFTMLQNHDAVIGPAKDGGYYLLGIKEMHTSIFQKKQWSTDTVLKDTLEDLKLHDVLLLEEKNDIDEFSDIEAHPAFQKFIIR